MPILQMETPKPSQDPAWPAQHLLCNLAAEEELEPRSPNSKAPDGDNTLLPSSGACSNSGLMGKENPSRRDSSPAKEGRPLEGIISRGRRPAVEGTNCVAFTGKEPKVKWRERVPTHLGSKLGSHGGLKLSTKIPTCSYLALGGELTRVPRAEIFHV